MSAGGFRRLPVALGTARGPGLPLLLPTAGHTRQGGAGRSADEHRGGAGVVRLARSAVGATLPGGVRADARRVASAAVPAAREVQGCGVAAVVVVVVVPTLWPGLVGQRSSD